MDVRKKPPTVKRSNVGPLRRPTAALLAADAKTARRILVGHVDARTKKHARLEYDVQMLRAEIARLTQLRQLLQTQALNSEDNHAGSACRIVKEYFEVFQRGYVEPVPSVLKQGAGFHPDEFLFSMMDEAVVGGGFTGVAVMIEQWKRYGTAFVRTRIQLQSAEVTSVDVDPMSGETSRLHVTATAYYSGNLTLAGVQGMFPHVMANVSLVMGLLGKVIGGLGSYIFVYDCAEKRVVENFIHIDLVSAFAKVVENAADLGLLFGEALVTSLYYLGDDWKEPSPLAPACEDNLRDNDALVEVFSDEDSETTGQQMSLDRILS